MNLKKTASNLTMVALIGGMMGYSQSDMRFKTKSLENGAQISVEKCSFLIDGYDIWVKSNYSQERLLSVNSDVFKDRRGNFYTCNKKYCKKLF